MGNTTDRAEIYGLWQRLGKVVPLWRYVLQGVATAWMRGGIDGVGQVRHGWIGKRIAPLVATASDAEITALAQIARLNQERMTWLARLVLLAYVTVPLTVVAIVVQVVGGSFTQLARDAAAGLGGALGGIIGGASAAVVGVYLNEARGRAMLLTLELIAIERTLSAAPAADAAQTPPAPAHTKAA